MPDTLRGVEIDEKGSSGTYVVIDDLPGLISLIQVGVLEIASLGRRADDVERPDRLVFDLDPGEGVAWAAVIEARSSCAMSSNRSVCKASCAPPVAKGCTLWRPLTRRTTWDDAKAFAHSFADSLVQSAPDRYIATMSKAKRRGKVFIDYLRNQRRAAVASYSTRAPRGRSRRHAPHLG